MYQANIRKEKEIKIDENKNKVSDHSKVRNLMSKIVVKFEYRDLFVGLKNMLLCLSYSKSATVRSKIMKIIK